MFLDPNQTTLAQLSLISQMAALERTGQLSGAECGIDFNALYQNTVELAVRAGSRVPPLSFVEAQPLDPETFTQSLCGFFRTKLSFDPAQDAFFSPRQILVQQGDSIVPMIIDKTDVRAALAATEGPAQDEIRKFEEVAAIPDIELFIFLLRSWDGRVHGLSVAMVYPWNDAGDLTMICSRDVKFNWQGQPTVADVGPAFVLSRLLYMKERGLWGSGAPILCDFLPEVLSSYRRRLPNVPRRLIHSDTSIGRHEAQHLLAGSTHNLAPIGNFVGITSGTTPDRSSRS